MKQRELLQHEDFPEPVGILRNLLPVSSCLRSTHRADNLDLSQLLSRQLIEHFRYLEILQPSDVPDPRAVGSDDCKLDLIPPHGLTKHRIRAERVNSPGRRR